MLFHCQNALRLFAAGSPQLSGKSCQEFLPSVHDSICSFHDNLYFVTPTAFTLIYVRNHAETQTHFCVLDNKQIEIMEIGFLFLLLEETKYLPV